MDVKEALPYIVSVFSLFLAFLAYKRNDKQDTTADATERATMTADIRYIRSSVDDIKLENKAMQKDLADMVKRLIIAEESIKRAHQRIDEIAKG